MNDPTAFPPSDLDELRRLIVDRRDSFTPGAEAVARFAFAHAEDVAFLSAPKLAELSGVSRATVQRLVAFLGFGSYRAFRELFREELRRRTPRPIHRAPPEGVPPRLGRGFGASPFSLEPI